MAAIADAAERYDDMSADAELHTWTPKIQAFARRAAKVLVFMNNHPKGQAVQNARRLQELLEAFVKDDDARKH